MSVINHIFQEHLHSFQFLVLIYFLDTILSSYIDLFVFSSTEWSNIYVLPV